MFKYDDQKYPPCDDEDVCCSTCSSVKTMAPQTINGIITICVIKARSFCLQIGTVLDLINKLL